MIPVIDVDAKDVPYIHCSCECPYFGHQHDHFFGVTCECGHREIACGYCLEAARVTECLMCGSARHNCPSGLN